MGCCGTAGATGGPIPAGGREDTLALLSPLIAPLFALGKPKHWLSPQGWWPGGLRARPGATRVIPSVPRRSPMAETPVHQTAGAPHQAQPAPQHPTATGQTLPLYPPLLYW